MNVVFMGTPDFSVPILDSLNKNFSVLRVYAQPDRPVGRGLKVQSCPVKLRALELGIEVRTPEKVSAVDEVEDLKKLNPDVIVVVAYGQILKQSVIDIPRLGCVNIHASLLPRWRGAAPIQHAIMSGDSETGVTTMKIVQKLDAGDMLLKSTTPILDSDDSASLFSRLSLMGAELIVPTLVGLEQGTITPIRQEDHLVTIASKLTKEMEQLDLSRSARELFNQIRGQSPWPGASVRLADGGRLKIKQVEWDEKSNSALDLNTTGNMTTAEIKVINDSLWLVNKLGEQKIRLIQVQEEGKKAVTTDEYISMLKSRGVNGGLQLL